jgi:putative mRNA 3-end processing factor
MAATQPTTGRWSVASSVVQTSDILTLTPAGLYCPPGDFHIDAMRAVPRNIVTHAHGDHARAGHGSVLATAETLDIMAIRMGPEFCQSRQIAVPGVRQRIGDVDVSLHPAGHILGSAQVAIEKDGFRVVVSGDYKRAADPTCAPFEIVRCDAYVTEATFGLPVFDFPDAAVEISRLLNSLSIFPDRTHVVSAYSLGKAQRVIRLLRLAGYDQPIYHHGAITRIAEYYRDAGVDLGDIRPVETAGTADLAGEIVVGPPGAVKSGWPGRFHDPLIAGASGWMQVRARARQAQVQLPLVISDHADWPALCATVQEAGCPELWVTHGETEALVHWAKLQGIDARPLDLIGYGDEEAETAVAEAAA